MYPSVCTQDEVVDQEIEILLAVDAGGLLQILQRLPRLLEIWRSAYGSSRLATLDRQAMAVQRMGYGYDRPNQPSDQ